MTSHSRLISVKSLARFLLEWQRELSLMFDSRNVCGTWRGRGKYISVLVFQSRIFSHLFFSFIHSNFMQHRCPNSADTCIKLLYCTLLVVWVSGHLHDRNREPPDCCLFVLAIWQYFHTCSTATRTIKPGKIPQHVRIHTYWMWLQLVHLLKVKSTG